MPWKGSNAREIITFLEQGVRLDRPLATSEKLWSLMLSCWNGDPSKRPTFDEIIELSLELAPPEVSVVKVKHESSALKINKNRIILLKHTLLYGVAKQSTQFVISLIGRF